MACADGVVEEEVRARARSGSSSDFFFVRRERWGSFCLLGWLWLCWPVDDAVPCCWASGAGDGGGATDGERGDGDAVRAAAAAAGDAGVCGAVERERREWERAGESRGSE